MRRPQATPFDSSSQEWFMVRSQRPSAGSYPHKTTATGWVVPCVYTQESYRNQIGGVSLIDSRSPREDFVWTRKWHAEGTLFAAMRYGDRLFGIPILEAATLYKVDPVGVLQWRIDFAAESGKTDLATGGFGGGPMTVLARSCDIDVSGNVYQAGGYNVPVVSNPASYQRPLYTLRSYYPNGDHRWSWSSSPGGIISSGVRTGPPVLSQVRCLPSGKVIVGDLNGVATMLDADGNAIWTVALTATPPVGTGTVTGFQLLETTESVSLWIATGGGATVWAVFSNADGSQVAVGGGAGGVRVIATMAADGTVVEATGNGGSSCVVVRHPPPYATSIATAGTSLISVMTSIRTDGNLIVVTGLTTLAGTGRYFICNYNTSYPSFGNLASNFPGSPGMVQDGAIAEDVLYVGQTIGLRFTDASSSAGAHRRSRSMVGDLSSVDFPLTSLAVTDARVNADGTSIWCGIRAVGAGFQQEP